MIIEKSRMFYNDSSNSAKERIIKFINFMKKFASFKVLYCSSSRDGYYNLLKYNIDDSILVQV